MSVVLSARIFARHAALDVAFPAGAVAVGVDQRLHRAAVAPHLRDRAAGRIAGRDAAAEAVVEMPRDAAQADPSAR